VKYQLLAVFCSLQAWQRGLDCIWIDRFSLYRYLGVDRLTIDVVQTLAHYFKPWFPYHEHDMGNFFGEWENSVKFSRFPDSEVLKNRVGNLNIPKGGLTAETLWHGISSMLMGFNEPLASLGFNELDRTDKEFDAFLKNWNAKIAEGMAAGLSREEALQKVVSNTAEQAKQPAALPSSFQ
jgi:hypothetical protein